jgi:aldehyde:ferredoxin oxidoreductase
LFTTFAIGAPELANQLETASGFNYTVEEVLLAGERIWNLERLFNLKNGFTKADDTLPARLLKEPVKVGPYKGQVSKLNVMLPEYYKERGWDVNGVPTKDKLQQLSIESNYAVASRSA